MSKPYHFIPHTRSMNWVERQPTQHTFTVHFKFVRSFSPVITMPIYTGGYRDCFDYLEAVSVYLPNTKHRQIMVKQVGSRHRHFFYDERFAAALEMHDVDGDEFFEEKTEEDKRYVQLHQKKGIVRAIWKGASRRGDSGRLNDGDLPF